MPTSESLRAAVVGASGFVGGELLRLLSGHPRVGALRAFSESGVGKTWAEVHPALTHVAAGRFEAGDPVAVRSWADVTFLALPHGRSQLLAGEFLDTAPRLVVDMSADFRIADRGLYEAAYGPHAAFEQVQGFTYGLADRLGEALAGKARIATPGCFATAALLALWPFAGRLAAPASVFAVTGSSGAGVEPRRTTHHPVRAHSFFAYSLAGHRHEAEIVCQLRGWGCGQPCRLIAHAAPLVRGIHATAHLRLVEPVPQPGLLLAEVYAGRPFVRVLERPPELAAVVGTNFAHLHAVPRDGGREVLVTVAIDNLVKGAAGQAVQAANLALSLGETAGLTFPGLYPC
ncbi:MAG: N-acetyl-gamma-glutamyl-phosphate reductase [Acidobacteriota bacterium]